MTDKHQHTPGPWTLQLHTCDTIDQMDGRDDWTIRGADGSAVCTEGGWHSAEVAQANVALILAAPELLTQRDCRLCAHYTAASGGCRSVVKCVDSDQYAATAPRQYWETLAEAAP